jgi:hypothetical protein
MSSSSVHPANCWQTFAHYAAPVTGAYVVVEGIAHACERYLHIPLDLPFLADHPAIGIPIFVSAALLYSCHLVLSFYEGRRVILFLVVLSLVAASVVARAVVASRGAPPEGAPYVDILTGKVRYYHATPQLEVPK